MYTDMAGWDEMGNPVISTDVLSPFTAQTFLIPVILHSKFPRFVEDKTPFFHWFDPDLYPGYVYLLFLHITGDET